MVGAPVTRRLAAISSVPENHQAIRPKPLTRALLDPTRMYQVLE